MTANTSISANKNISVSSDENLKNIVSSIEIPIEDIANARIVNFTYKDGGDKQYAGTIAQDWEKIVPNALNTGEDGYYNLDYSAISIVSAVTAAKEIVRLKKENE